MMCFSNNPVNNLIPPLCEMSCACTDLVTIHPLSLVWYRVLMGIHPNSVTVLMYFAAETEEGYRWAEAAVPDKQVCEQKPRAVIRRKNHRESCAAEHHMTLQFVCLIPSCFLYLRPPSAAALPPKCWPGPPVRDQRSFPAQPAPAGRHSAGSPAGGSLHSVASCNMCGSCS